MDFYKMLSQLESNIKNIVITIISGDNIGSKLLLYQGEIIFTTCDKVDWKAIIELIPKDEKSQIITFGNNRVYIEFIRQNYNLVVCGAGHISISIIKMCKFLDLSVTVIDDRLSFANNAINAGADNVICDGFDSALDKIAGDKGTFFVIVTRGHRYDQTCLQRIIEKESAYIGMIGSKLRVAKVLDYLEEEGISRDELNKVYTPIGLKIGAETPAEIAVSIMAQIIEVKNKGALSGMYSDEVMDCILGEKYLDIPKTMITIVSRKGSTPRGVGTKMVVLRDGTMIGTIGGGCVESSIRQTALACMDDNKSKLVKVDMTGQDAEDDGMVCGGVVEIFIEPLKKTGQCPLVRGLIMKQIKTVDAVGQVICHDITQIIKGVTKDTVFKKGHVIKEEDIPVLLSVGKENIYIWEKQDGMLHENEAAEILYNICKNDYMRPSPVKEGKIEIIADTDGLFKLDLDRLYEINSLGEMMIATRHGNTVVKKGDKLAGTRVIPLVIEEDKMKQAEKIGAGSPIMEIMPFKHKKVGIVTTGSEVFHGRIKDTFGPVIVEKLSEFDTEILGQKIVDDDMNSITEAILNYIENGADIVVCTGGMSVDPDDKTPGSIKNTGANVISYGAPALPGAMMLVAYYDYKGNKIPVLGLPGCVMYAKRTIFDLILPRVMADDNITKSDIDKLGRGGLCLSCDICTYPNCGFGKGM